MQDSYHYWDNRLSEDLWWSPYVEDFRHMNTLLEPIHGINEQTPPSAPVIQWGAFCRFGFREASWIAVRLHQSTAKDLRPDAEHSAAQMCLDAADAEP